MITNDKQYKTTNTLISQLRQTLQTGSSVPEGVHPVFASAHQAALASQLRELEDSVAEYDRLKSGSVTAFEANSLRELPRLLIEARIARNMSQKELAAFVGIHEQQIQRYEAENYRSASLERLAEIADALSVKISERCELVGFETATATELDSFNSYPISEMYKRGYFEDFAGTAAQARKAASSLIPAFFRTANRGFAPVALHRRSIRFKGPVQEFALAAWEARVVIKAERSRLANQFCVEAISKDWLKNLVSKSVVADGVASVRDYLGGAGIALVIEPHLPGTLLDGAAMLTDSGVYVVALTLRHDRQDNFWFTLLHEIAHLVLHVGKDQLNSVFDNNDVVASSTIEEEADNFALNAAIDPLVWPSLVSRFTRTERAVLGDASRLGVGQAIVAGRIRREANDYTLLSGLVGSGEVRKYFGC
jgi:HTH-type transcriptional regulator / antitoxin HigA